MRANIPIVGRSSSTVSFSSGAGTVGLRPIKVTLRDSCCETQVILPTAPGVSNEGRSSPLLALSFSLGLVGTASSRR